MTDHESTDLAGAAHLAREDMYTDRPAQCEYQDAPIYVPPAVVRVWDEQTGAYWTVAA